MLFSLIKFFYYYLSKWIDLIWIQNLNEWIEKRRNVYYNNHIARFHKLILSSLYVLCPINLVLSSKYINLNPGCPRLNFLFRVQRTIVRIRSSKKNIGFIINVVETPWLTLNNSKLVAINVQKRQSFLSGDSPVLIIPSNQDLFKDGFIQYRPCRNHKFVLWH